MKKKVLFLTLSVSIMFLGGCGNADTENVEKQQSPSDKAVKQTAVTLTAGDTVLEGYLNDSKAAGELINQLPLTVTLNDSDNDFCGGDLSLHYEDGDVRSGYKNGDLAFWTPANNFVIFVDDEENSADTGDIVNLGHITSPQEKLDALEGTIDVTISLAGGKENEKQEEVSEMEVKIKAGGQEWTARLEDNDTSRAIYEMLPLTLPMMDLYGREMCYRFEEELPTSELCSDGYEIGDLAYWPPRHSFVILYKQNGEEFERQHIGHIETGAELFDGMGNTEVTIERAIG